MISGSDPTGRAPWVGPFARLVTWLLLLAGSGWWAYREIRDGGEPQFPIVASVGLLVLVGVTLTTVLKRLRADPPSLTLTPDSVRPGEELAAVYRQRFRRPARVTEAVVRLVMEEEAVKGSGKSRTAHTHRVVIQETKRTELELGADDELVLSLNARIPADAMHTFDFGDNELTWKVEANVAIKGWPDEADFEFLEVRAEPPG